MSTPVFRHLDTKAAFLGLSFPVEWTLVVLLFFSGSACGQTLIGFVAAIGLYAFLRIVGHGRPEDFLQHWIVFNLRQLETGGRFSAAARTRVARFPFGSHAPLEPLSGEWKAVARRFDSATCSETMAPR